MTTATEHPQELNAAKPATDEFTRFDGLEARTHDELVNLARDLGVRDCEDAPSDKLRRRIANRVAILRGLNIEALMDVLRWGRCPIPPHASKSNLIREIQIVNRADYETLSHPGLMVLAQLRGIRVEPTDHADAIIERLREGEGFWSRLNRRRRKWIGSLLDRMVEAPTSEPEPQQARQARDPATDKRLRSEIETHGVVGGIASRLRGAADSYIETKLDEIERRIDEKLEDIDRRLAEWRDREVANRLRILRITLAFTLVVALLSLGYNVAKKWVVDAPWKAEKVEQVE